MKLTIDNPTHFSTRALRGIVLAVYRHVAREEKETLYRLHVLVGYARTWGQAHGALGAGRMSLFFRKSHERDLVKDAVTGRWRYVRPAGFLQPLTANVAADVRHELMHNLGFHHTLRSTRADRFFYDRPLPDALVAKLVATWGPRLPFRGRSVSVRDREPLPGPDVEPQPVRAAGAEELDRLHEVDDAGLRHEASSE